MFMPAIRHVFVAVSLSLCCLPSIAADIPGQCLVSFDVKDNTFVSGVTTMSCKQVEARRVELFNRINALPPTGNLDGNAIASDLSKIEDLLKKTESDKDWVGMANNVTGNFLATLGLAACFETAGAGCAVAIIGKVSATLSILGGAMSEADKIKQTSAMREQVAVLKAKVTGNITPAEKIRSRLVSEFTGLCNDEKQYCLK